MTLNDIMRVIVARSKFKVQTNFDFELQIGELVGTRFLISYPHTFHHDQRNEPLLSIHLRL